MRRNLVHLLIAMTAFAAGTASAALWNSMARPEPISAAPAILLSKPANEAVVIESEGPPVAVKSSSKFRCDSRLFAFLLKDLRKNNPTSDIDGLIEASGVEFCSELFEIVALVDLNGDGRSEFIISTRNNKNANFFAE